MSGYHLTVLTRDSKTKYESHGVLGDVPHIGDLLTIHPDGKVSSASFTCDVSGVQRVIHHYPDNPELWPKQSSVHVTARAS